MKNQLLFLMIIISCLTLLISTSNASLEKECKDDTECTVPMKEYTCASNKCVGNNDMVNTCKRCEAP